MGWSLEMVLSGAAGISIGLFDRSLRYVALYGDGEDGRQLGLVVGSKNDPPYAQRTLKAAQAAIHRGSITNFEVVYRDRIYDVRTAPIRVPPFDIVGGALYAWDVTARVAERIRHSAAPPPHKLEVMVLVTPVTPRAELPAHEEQEEEQHE